MTTRLNKYYYYYYFAHVRSRSTAVNGA